MQPLLGVVSDLLFVEWKEWKRDESDTVHFLRCMIVCRGYDFFSFWIVLKRFVNLKSYICLPELVRVI